MEDKSNKKLVMNFQLMSKKKISAILEGESFFCPGPVGHCQSTPDCMHQERFNHVMMINTYKERVVCVDTDKLLNIFVNCNDMRRRTFAVHK